jgi:hypothetical protein
VTNHGHIVDIGRQPEDFWVLMCWKNGIIHIYGDYSALYPHEQSSLQNTEVHGHTKGTLTDQLAENQEKTEMYHDKKQPAPEVLVSIIIQQQAHSR